ncbi:MAG: efflux RND transporter permease subunit [Flavobacteriaceae bacterium]|nr:efflux RND transporter permease subunit [Flavobacteriaceae bacterium]
MIPISFIGAFFTFYIFKINFDQGGYASLILLCGISVNAALFLLNDYHRLKSEFPEKPNKILNFKAFNQKIIPIVLTILSTIVGLVPFLWDGKNDVFWFSFAAGVIGGLIFSMIGILFYLPLMMITNEKLFKPNEALEHTSGIGSSTSICYFYIF